MKTTIATLLLCGMASAQDVAVPVSLPTIEVPKTEGEPPAAEEDLNLVTVVEDEEDLSGEDFGEEEPFQNEEDPKKTYETSSYSDDEDLQDIFDLYDNANGDSGLLISPPPMNHPEEGRIAPPHPYYNETIHGGTEWPDYDGDNDKITILPLLPRPDLNRPLKFTTPGQKCPNPFKTEWDMMAPFPKNCRVYMNSSPCNQYEISQTREVLSCEIAEACFTVIASPKCVEYYPDFPEVPPIEPWLGPWASGASQLAGGALAAVALASQMI